MEGRGEDDLQRGWVEGVLEGIYALFFASFSGERGCFSGF